MACKQVSMFVIYASWNNLSVCCAWLRVEGICLWWNQTKTKSKLNLKAACKTTLKGAKITDVKTNWNRERSTTIQKEKSDEKMEKGYHGIGKSSNKVLISVSGSLREAEPRSDVNNEQLITVNITSNWIVWKGRKGNTKKVGKQNGRIDERKLTTMRRNRKATWKMSKLDNAPRFERVTSLKLCGVGMRLVTKVKSLHRDWIPHGIKTWKGKTGKITKERKVSGYFNSRIRFQSTAWVTKWHKKYACHLLEVWKAEARNSSDEVKVHWKSNSLQRL